MEDRHGLKPLLERILSDREHGHHQDAWNGLMVRLRPIIRALLLKRVDQDADASDLTQDVQHRLLRYFPRFRGETIESFLAWMNQILASVLAAYVRDRQKDLAPLPGEDGPPEPVPEPEAFDAEQLSRVLHAVERLREPYRQIIQAFYLKEQSCVEIAQRLQRTPVWVRVTKLHALRQLRTVLGEDHAS
jgi:RNA polymerase sigma factor (sigma-70 family)